MIPRKHLSLIRALLTLVVLVVATGPLAACAKSSKTADVVALRERVQRTLKRPWIGIRAPETFGGYEYDMVPLDMWAPCRWETTCGLFDEDRDGIAENAYFGTSLDTRGAPDLIAYGIYASKQPTGLYVTSEIDGLPEGSIFPGGQMFTGARRIDMAIEADGTDLRFYARDADIGGAYTPIGTHPFASQPYPLVPGVEVGGLTGNVEIGFAGMRVVSNSAPPAPVGKAQAAVNAILSALQALSEVKDALADGDATVPEIVALMNAAITGCGQARTAVAAVPAGSNGAKEKRSNALRDANAARNKLRSAKSAFETKGDAGRSAATKSVGLRAYDLILAADEILPKTLRDALPGKRHTLLR